MAFHNSLRSQNRIGLALSRAGGWARGTRSAHIPRARALGARGKF